MDETKPWFKSKATVGSIVAVLALASGFAGYNVLPELQAQIVDTFLQVVALAASVVALVGRITASKKVV